jgi:hypothetical protein
VKDRDEKLRHRIDEALQLAADHKVSAEIQQRILAVWDSICDHPGMSSPRFMAWPRLDEIAHDAPVLGPAIRNIQRSLGERRPS